MSSTARGLVAGLFLALILLAQSGLSQEVVIQRFTPDADNVPAELREAMPLPADEGKPGVEAHPAVVRVNCPDGNAMYHGTGTLVAVGPRHGIVITNWHVVRDCRGPMTVRFPNGFLAMAKVLRVDEVWDLAALLIARPEGIEPVPLAVAIPKRGQRLTIAGYGGGNYREAEGQMAQLCCPAVSFPAEILEVSAGARFGDSGGPIFTPDRRLAGVLFGSARGYTNGSHCGRVRQFLRETVESVPKWGRNIRPMELALRERDEGPSPSAVAAVDEGEVIPAAAIVEVEESN